MNRLIGELVDRAAAVRARVSTHIAELQLSQPQVAPEQVTDEMDLLDLREADDIALLYGLAPRTRDAALSSESATLLN